MRTIFHLRKAQLNQIYFWLLNVVGALLISLPFLIIAYLAKGVIGVGALLLVLVPVVLLLLIYAIRTTRARLEKTLKELTALNQISQTLLSSLELKNLLAVLQLQLRELLAVDNFYIALYDRNTGKLGYPMAVMRGQLVSWAPQSEMNRLTEQVIRARQPYMITQSTLEAEHELEHPIEVHDFTAWMGVPLIAHEQAIGCLAVFVSNPENEFTQADLEALVMVSGQVSVAVANALLSEQMQQRATQLETMSQIATLISEKQNLQEVLEQVCRSVVEVGWGEKSALFLVDQERSEVTLACAHGFSDDFIRNNRTMPISQDGRTRCLRTGKPLIVADINQSKQPYDENFLQSLRAEEVCAFGDFPLITPGGQIGFLTVYSLFPRSFSDVQMRLVQTIAAQAALSISSARLYVQTDTVLARRANQLSIIEAIGRELAEAIRSERLFEAILDYALEFTNSNWGRLALLDTRSQRLIYRAMRGYPNVHESQAIISGITGRVVRTGLPVNLPDVSSDPDYVDLSGGLARSLFCVPLVHKEKILGVLTLESTQANAYTGLDLAFINQLVNQAAIALVNAELYANIARGRDHLAAVINSVREGLLMIEDDGRITLANPFITAITGLSLEDILGVNLVELPSEALRALGFSAEQASQMVFGFVQGDMNETTKHTYSISEVNRVMERTTELVRGENERPIGWMLVLRDVTEEHHLAQERELLTETLVHDLRSPIGAVLGSLELIQSENPIGQDANNTVTAKAVNVAWRGAQRVLRLVDAMLDIAHWEAGESKLAISSVKLANLVNEVLADYQNQAWDYGLVLKNDIPEDLMEVQADQEKIQRVLSNLVDNALKFTPTGGEVSIQAKENNTENVEVCICDTGPGVPPEYRQKIFERFCQVPGLQGRRRGSGLGLTFCKLAIEAHGGKIWVEDRAGGGSVFKFTLPFVEEIPYQDKSVNNL